MSESEFRKILRLQAQMRHPFPYTIKKDPLRMDVAGLFMAEEVDKTPHWFDTFKNGGFSKKKED